MLTIQPTPRKIGVRISGDYRDLHCFIDALERHPVDRLMHDIALALMAVQTQTTEILSDFPTKAAADRPPAKAEQSTETTSTPA